MHTSGSQEKHSSQNTIDNRNVFGPYWYLGLFCICTFWLNSFGFKRGVWSLVWIVLILKEEVEVFKKENGPEIGFKKGYLKISRSMSKSEFTEWIFHRCIHYFQVKYASPGCPIWHSIGIWKSHCSKISKRNHVFFSASKAANHLTLHQTFG